MALILWCLIILCGIMMGSELKQSQQASRCPKTNKVLINKSVPYYVTVANKNITRYRTVRYYKNTTEMQCCAGFIKDGTKCLPHCPEGCPQNAKCSKPRHCSCMTGYSGPDCSPVCSPTCQNGTCVAPNKCQCKPGFKANRNESKHVCIPHCDVNCSKINAQCASPQECICNRGFKWSDTRENCLPMCRLECRNGWCSGPDLCTCNKGYSYSNQFLCVPKCSPPCENGVCISPEKCVCLPGYRSSHSDAKNVCVPVCDQDCSNGTCTSPGVCVCNDGFYKQKVENGQSYCASIGQNFSNEDTKNITKSEPANFTAYIISADTLNGVIGVAVATLLLITSISVVVCIKRRNRQANKHRSAQSDVENKGFLNSPLFIVEPVLSNDEWLITMTPRRMHLTRNSANNDEQINV